MPDTILSLSGIHKRFGGVHALNDVSLDIRKGEIHCLAGENGSGKSTLIKVIAGVYAPDSGAIELAGKQYKRLTPPESIKQGVQIIYQDFSIFPNLSVAENIAFGLQIAQRKRLTNWKEIYKLAEGVAASIGFEVNLHERMENLGVASKQLAAICRALLNEAKLLIMDEPTTALTQKEVKSLFHIVKQLQQKGVSVLFVSHKLDEVFEIAERFSILRNGKLVITDDTAALSRENFVYYMTGRNINEERFTRSLESEEKLLEVKGLTLNGSYYNVNFQLFKGEIIGITGLLGSGRTELALSLFGALKPDSGEIFVHGEKKKLHSIPAAIRSKIGYLPEDRLSEGLFLPQSIDRNIGVSNLRKYMGKLFKLDKAAMRKATDASVAEFAIATDNPEKPVQTLSGGNQQKVVLARWMELQPDIMIFNGPTVGVDIAVKYDIHNMLRDLANKGIGVVIISDDIPEVYANSSRILVMKDGRIAREFKSGETSEAELSDIMMGSAAAQ